MGAFEAERARKLAERRLELLISAVSALISSIEQGTAPFISCMRRCKHFLRLEADFSQDRQEAFVGTQRNKLGRNTCKVQR